MTLPSLSGRACCSAHALWLCRGKPCPAAACFQRRTRPGLVRGPDTVTPSSWAQSSGPRARRLGIYQEQRHGGAWRRCTELQSHLVSQSAPRSLRSERPSPSSCPATRDLRGCCRPAGRRFLARGFCTSTGPGPTPGSRTSLPLMVKIKTQKNCTRRSKEEKEKAAAV